MVLGRRAALSTAPLAPVQLPQNASIYCRLPYLEQMMPIFLLLLYDYMPLSAMYPCRQLSNNDTAGSVNSVYLACSLCCRYGCGFAT